MVTYIWSHCPGFSRAPSQWRIQSWSQGGGGVPSHKFKGLVKVSASNVVIRVDWKNIMAGGGFPGNRIPPGYAIAVF